MHARCLLYYITDRTAFGQNKDEPTRRQKLLEKIGDAARAGIDFIQLREKDLATRDLESLTREAMRLIRDANSNTALLINSRVDIALAVEADGVHLRSDDISPQEVKAIWQKTHVGTAALGCPAVQSTAAAVQIDVPQRPLIGVSCHSPSEVVHAAAIGASFVVFGPVFGKQNSDVQPTGLVQLHEACKTNIPVLALGGITASDAQSCLEAGAAGIAGIRLFQENDIEKIARPLRGQGSRRS